MTADCLPLLIASRDGRYVCSVHAGWQGLVSGIVDNSLACFRQQGVALADLVIAVGPYIHPCCYEVSAGFYQQLLDQPGGDRVARHRQRLFLSRSGPVSDPLKAARVAAIICGLICAPLPKRSSQRRGWRRRALNGWGVVPTAPRSRWAPTGAGPIFRRRRAFSIRGSCAKPEAGSR
ncbi:membrane protein [Klebsiella pneumoniae]|uniref:Membrane protein n=1 Tax=Klebsiella pneumoniae TaxID=573 RepID=A0A378B0F9_KLEPN|nr:membrane protein [Klebsiella pneumoniae]